MTKERRNVTAEDWMRAAIDTLPREGPPGLRIARLAKHLGVTTGSFYWHFKDKEQFRARMLEFWMSQMLATAGDAAKRVGPGKAQIRALPGILMRQGLPLYDVAMRKWAAADPVVADAVEKADQLRTRRLAAMLAEAGFGEEEALERAQVVFWAFVGSSGVDLEIRLKAFETLIEAFLRELP